MTEHEPPPPDDRELEDFLAGRSPLSRAHREGAQEPAPPELDAEVLAAAREELRRARPSRRLLRWDGPLALAASMLLVLGLGWLTQMQMQGRRQLSQTQAEAGVPVAAAPAPAQPPLQEGAGKAAAAEPGKPMAALSVTKERRGEAERKVLPPPAKYSPSVVTPNAQPPAAPRPFPSAPPPLPAPPAPATAATSTAAPAPAAQDSAREQDRTADQSAAVAAAAPRAAQPSAPMASAPQVQAFNAPAAAVRAKAEETASGATLPDPCASPRRLPAQKQAQPEAREDAAAWLEQIRKLRDTAPGAASAELACFAARNPQAGVPDDLKALMPGQP